MRLIVGAVLSALLVASSAMAQQPQTPATPAPAPDAAAQLASDPLNTNATYAYIMDGDSGVPLYSKRGDEPMIPASMSKLMLYYMVFERIKAGRLKLTDEFTVSEHAWRTGGAGTGLSARCEQAGGIAAQQDADIYHGREQVGGDP